MKLFPNNRYPAGYTLVEILGVLAIIVILAGISFGTAAGINSVRMNTIARAEIALISQSLSLFYAEHGDYPITQGEENNAITLSKALLGWKVFHGDSLKMIDKESNPSEAIKPYIDLSKIFHKGKLAIEGNIPPSDIKFVDPWGQPYVYFYKESKAWDNLSYVLYSKGPDIKDNKLDDDGVVSVSFKNLSNNIDNIYLED